ncbi:hypothetical protein PINS_up020426 [Pythium insidiosum]|nr:hypothetical protein PINS_up010196 [Pythium insidiosum]GLE08951.1 hypothetical protein PINS_up020426 [Pythium insidiosum]
MKVYGHADGLKHVPAYHEERRASIKSTDQQQLQAQAERRASSGQQPDAHAATQTIQDMERALRVKDQMIYQLLQERTALRREKASMESYLQELTSISTDEMKKWSKLTDEMQAEIELLRSHIVQDSHTVPWRT